MMEHFQNVINVEFTAGMEKQLDEVEEGQLRWKKVLEDFYAGFHQEMLDAEEALKDTRLKVPDEVTDEICELCGRNMVVKTGRFGKFLACPGYRSAKTQSPSSSGCRAAARSAAAPSSSASPSAATPTMPVSAAPNAAS